MQQKQRKEISFEGQNIYLGIDVHLKQWHVTVLTESGYTKTFSQVPSAQALFDYLKKHYPAGTYKAVYESGFSGFSTYYSLQAYGISCMIIHAADLPSSQYEQVMKTDNIDSKKLARGLKEGSLRGIYVHCKDNLDHRSVVRLRKTLQRQLDGYKSRVKHLLHNHGVCIPARFKSSGYWSKAFIYWLREDVILLSSSRLSLDLLLDQVELFRRNLLEITHQVRALSRSQVYREAYQLLVSIPGIGMKTAMCLLTEIQDFSRFANQKQFASYLGLIPTSHSSGEKISHGQKTFRGNKQIGAILMESAWTSIRCDRTMAYAYSNYCKRMKANKAIVRIARKLSNRIFSVIKNKKLYDNCR